ncbi:hypothetical protein [Pseudoalteromonas mariniglutinosa]|uniref:hypothetical protein n=1 Tax=Pseudoalteromonas mariniglutinosa TaxID=206042 RepID=UPI00384B4452
MATKPNLNDHVSLLFELYNRIPRLSRVTAIELQQQLADVAVVRDIRTVQRNLDVLVRHLNVYKDTRDRPYGYHRASLPIKTFGPRESMLLQLAEGWLTQSFPLEYKAIINSIFTEIHQVKTQSASTQNDNHQPYSDVQSQSLIKNYSTKFNAVFEQLTYGIIQQQIVNIVLDESELSIEPLSLWIHSNTLFIVFQCLEHDYQHIEIEKIQDANLSTFNFKYPDDFNLKSYQDQHISKSNLASNSANQTHHEPIRFINLLNNQNNK